MGLSDAAKGENVLEARWNPMLDAIKYIFQDPSGPFIIAVADTPEPDKILFLSPPRSLKEFRESNDKPSLLNAGLASDDSLPKSRRLKKGKTEWILEQGWNRPQHPFNNYFSIPGPMGMNLNELLEFCLHSYVHAFDLTGDEHFGLNLSLVDQQYLAANFLTFHEKTGSWTIPSKARTSAAATATQLESQPLMISDEPSASTPPADKEFASPTSGTSTWKDSVGRDLHVGAEVSFSGKSGSNVLQIDGVVVGENAGKARIEVAGGQPLPKNEYLIPWSNLRLR